MPLSIVLVAKFDAHYLDQMVIKQTNKIAGWSLEKLMIMVRAWFYAEVCKTVLNLLLYFRA
ncbi:hypothetical protein DXX93_15685 [Thalassotalea euphylliae]|uniref:Uncharacterized protein n=1 Tax=Thalassotalea euphylliae TaxID=1655234 RepID=A0A3E0TV89_9GAMM|nr:hypothetical protein DXX93_15685 [Thalassotalea euphylliae]